MCSYDYNSGKSVAIKYTVYYRRQPDVHSLFSGLVSSLETVQGDDILTPYTTSTPPCPAFSEHHILQPDALDRPVRRSGSNAVRPFHPWTMATTG